MMACSASPNLSSTDWRRRDQARIRPRCGSVRRSCQSGAVLREWESASDLPLSVLAGRSARGLDGAGDLGCEFGVDQKLVDECGEDFLSGHAGDSEAVGGLSLPDVEGAVCCGGEVDGASCSLGACGLVGCGLVDDSLGVGLSEAGEALGWCRVGGWGGR